MTWRNEYEKSVLLFTKHCIIDAKIAVGFDAEITAPENAKNTAFVIPGYIGLATADFPIVCKMKT